MAGRSFRAHARVLALDDHRWVIAESHGGSGAVRAAPFAAVELELAPLWVD